jgi:hypothetical protein
VHNKGHQFPCIFYNICLKKSTKQLVVLERTRYHTTSDRPASEKVNSESENQ